MMITWVVLLITLVVGITLGILIAGLLSSARHNLDDK